MMQAIKTEYDKRTKQLWTIKENISKDARYVKQNTSRGQFACFNLSFELCKSEVPIIFENNVTLQKELVNDIRFKEELGLYVDRIYKTIEEELNQLYVIGYPVADIKIVLSNLIIHPTDSNEFSYKIATQMVIKEVLNVDNLVPLSC